MPSHRRSDSESGYTFNPVEALVEDAVGDSPELFTDFLDKLLVQVPLESGVQSPGATPACPMRDYDCNFARRRSHHTRSTP